MSHVHDGLKIRPTYRRECGSCRYLHAEEDNKALRDRIERYEEFLTHLARSNEREVKELLELLREAEDND